MVQPSFRCGFAIIVGPPNAGKSTLMNELLDYKLSIVTPKPQTTRKKITGIYHRDDCQIVFLDTPGIMQPQQKLHVSMLAIVRETLKDADVVIALIPYSGKGDHIDRTFTDELFKEWIRPAGKPVVAVLNKCDLVTETQRREIEDYVKQTWSPDAMISISALQGTSLPELVDTIVPFLPSGPPLYPEDTLSTAPERFFVTEIIREKIFLQYGKEVPYSAEVVIDEFREQHEADPSRKDLIRCSVIVERDTQKQILIGQKGASLKKLGQAARRDIEEMLGRPVFLELFVKVRPDWRKKNNLLKSYGY
ncbi:MAG: GTPase Era [Chlorobiaceae bacterium]|nr:GTPase Era [Chlorobiaceae bacterium]